MAVFASLITDIRLKSNKHGAVYEIRNQGKAAAAFGSKSTGGNVSIFGVIRKFLVAKK